MRTDALNRDMSAQEKRTCHPVVTRGVAMVSAIALLLIIGTVAAVLLSVKSAAVSTQKAEVQRLRAAAAAMGATQLAVWQIGNDNVLALDLARVVCEGDTSFNATSLFQFDGDLAGANFTVEVWPGADTVRLKSLASAGGNYFERWAQIPLTSLVPGFTLSSGDAVLFQDNAMADSFDSRLGAYGGGNVGAEAVLSTNSISNAKVRLQNDSIVNGDVMAGPGANTSAVIKIQNNSVVTGDVGTLSELAPIPTLSLPTNTGPDLGNLTLSAGTTTWASNYHFQDVSVSGTAVIEVSGNVTVLCDGEAQFVNSAQLRLLADSSLSIYFLGGVRFGDDARINVNTADPIRMTIYMLGTDGQLDLTDDAQVYAIGINPAGKLHVTNTSDFHGAYVGHSLHISESGAIHQDVGLGGCQSSP